MKTSRERKEPRELKVTLVAATCISAFVACSGGDPELTPPIKDAPLGAAQAPEHLSEEDVLYLNRFERMIKAFETGQPLTTIYDNLADVPGADVPTGLPQASGGGLEQSTLQVVIDYTKARNTSALLVVKNGELILEEYMDGFDPDTPLNGKSLAKPLGVIAVGRAIKEGHVRSLDQRASDFLTEWKGTPKEAITLRQLLGMRSGLHHQSNDPSPDHVMNRAYLHPRHTEIIINEYPQLHPPGVRYDYSNANAELIAPIIERATDKTYAEWISAEVLVRLNAKGGEIWLNREGGVAHAGCCILLPAETFAKLGLLLLGDGVWEGEALLPDGFVNDMRKPGADNLNAGLGVYLGEPYTEYRGAQNPDRDGYPTYHSEPYAREDLYLFDGNSNQVVYMVPSENLLILRMGATPPRDKAWDNAVVPNLILNSLEYEE